MNANFPGLHQAAKRAVSMDNAETQPMEDSQGLGPSPISKMRTLDHVADTQQDDTDGSSDESAEEETKTSDEEVEVLQTVTLHDNVCIEVESDAEPATAVPPLQDAPSLSTGTGLCCNDLKPGTESDPPHVKQVPPDVASEGMKSEEPKGIEEIMDSDEDNTQSKRGTFKVGTMCMWSQQGEKGWKHKIHITILIVQ